MSDIIPNSLQKPRKIVFLILPQMHILDFAGPCQVFYEANQLGTLNMSLHYISFTPSCTTEQGLTLSNLSSPDNLNLTTSDLVLVPGMDYASFCSGNLEEVMVRVRPWLREVRKKNIPIASICSGSMILADAGILDGLGATSHWKCLDQLSREHPQVKVKRDRLFVYDRNVYTSAGMSSGIDMCLSIIEEWYGPVLASKTAREMVVFLRRNQDHDQESVYLDYQSHFNAAIHQVQNYLIAHPDQNPSLPELAALVNMSVRNLTRLFREVTGHTITAFKHRLKLEVVKSYLHNPDLTLAAIAYRCGFRDERQLRRIWKSATGISLQQSRRSAKP